MRTSQVPSSHIWALCHTQMLVLLHARTLFCTMIIQDSLVRSAQSVSSGSQVDEQNAFSRELQVHEMPESKNGNSHQF